MKYNMQLAYVLLCVCVGGGSGCMFTFYKLDTVQLAGYKRQSWRVYGSLPPATL